MRKKQDGVATVANAIRRYCAFHPDAADSADGVQRWWLLQVHEEPLAVVELALERLVEEGVMRRLELEAGRVVYANARRPS